MFFGGAPSIRYRAGCQKVKFATGAAGDRVIGIQRLAQEASDIIGSARTKSENGLALAFS